LVHCQTNYLKMKKLIGSIFAVVLFATFSFAGKPFPADNTFWNKAFAKLAESQLTGQSKQLPLPYAYNALEPSIDAKTMEIHYSKHHAAYTKNLNDATTGPEYASKTLFQLFTEIEKYPVLVKNNGGGFYNHLLFWTLMAPVSGQEPTGDLLKAINDAFGSVDKFKEVFGNAGKKQFGSGWAWLLVNEQGKLVVSSTPNQDNPLMSTTEVRGIPVLTLDVWEHAYYLQYQNRRPEYVEAFWKIVNWKEVSRRYDEAIKAIK